MADADNQKNENNDEERDGEPQEEMISAKTPKMVMVTDEELKHLKREASEYKDKYLRLLADSDNARKRLLKEKQDLVRSATENVVVDILHPLDNLENALTFAQQMSDDVKHWALGFQMILSQFKEALANNGVEALQSKGSVFDPHSHEAVEMIETDKYIPGTIMEECVRGYKIGDRTIRPARVKVAKPVTKKESDENA